MLVLLPSEASCLEGCVPSYASNRKTWNLPSRCRCISIVATEEGSAIEAGARHRDTRAVADVRVLHAVHDALLHLSLHHRADHHAAPIGRHG